MSQLLENFAKPEIKDTVVTYSTLAAPIKELLLSAHAVRLRAYVPYSNFKVGAAFRSTSDNTIFTGCNVENAAFTPSACAERTALTKAVSEGCQKFATGAVVAYAPDVFTTPCGVCRQFIREFAGSTDIPIYIARALDERTLDKPFHDDDPVLVTSIFNLLPSSFHTYVN